MANTPPRRKKKPVKHHHCPHLLEIFEGYTIPITCGYKLPKKVIACCKCGKVKP